MDELTAQLLGTPPACASGCLCFGLLQHVCGRSTLPHGAANSTVCLLHIFVVSGIIIIIIFCSPLCDLKLVYYFVLISNFLRIILVLLLFLFAVIYFCVRCKVNVAHYGVT